MAVHRPGLDRVLLPGEHVRQRRGGLDRDLVSVASACRGFCDGPALGVDEIALPPLTCDQLGEGSTRNEQMRSA